MKTLSQKPPTAGMSRRQMLQASIGSSIAALVAAGELSADEPIFGTKAELGKEIDEALAEFTVEDLELIDAEFKAKDLQFAGKPMQLNPQVVQSFQSTQVPGCETAMVQTLDQGRAACHAALRTGRFDRAQIAVAQRDQNGNIIFPKDAQGYVRPSASYTSPMQIGSTRMDRKVDSEWETMLAGIGNDGSFLQRVQDYDRQTLWTPDQGLSLDDPLMHAGLFGRGRTSSGNCKPCYGNTQLQRCNTGGQQQCGYSYGNNCRTGNCNLRPLGTVGGLLRGEFLRPLSSTGGIRHLPLGKRLVARLFPRVAYRKGWVNCETAHLLLVKRLFWAIVIGIAAGTAGGGGAAGVIFLG